MSFSSNTKESLLEELPTKNCCKKAFLFGMLTYANVFARDRIKLITEIKPAADAVISLLDELYGIRTNLYITEHKNSREYDDASGAVNGYKITVSDKKQIEKMSADLPRGTLSLYRVNRELFERGCDKCRAHYLRGAFIVCGTVSRPDSSFHLELSTPYRNLASDTVTLCTESGVAPRMTVRGSSNVIYYKRNSDIADFLALIGANSASFEYINESIVRENRGLANRAVNCDTANIRKTVNAATEVMEAVAYLRENGLMDKLPDDLQRTAELRVGNPQASLSELSEMSQPRLTKSGVNHRIKKIIEFAEKYKRGNKD